MRGERQSGSDGSCSTAVVCCRLLLCGGGPRQLVVRSTALGPRAAGRLRLSQRALSLSLPLCVSLFLSSSLARSLVPSVLVCGRASAGGVVAARVHVAVVPAVVMRQLHWRRSLDACGWQ